MARSKESSLTIQFDSPTAMQRFWEWLEQDGEQHYWAWQKDLEEAEEGDITVLEFKYDGAAKGLITTVCGRFTEGK